MVQQKQKTQQLPAVRSPVPGSVTTNLRRKFSPPKSRLEAFNRHATGSRGKLKEPQRDKTWDRVTFQGFLYWDMMGRSWRFTLR